MNENQDFTYRVGAICLHDDNVLLCRAEGDEHWFIPGGRVDFGEDSKQTLIREVEEELGVEVEPKRLLWTIENFFELKGKSHQEIAFYYEVDLPDYLKELEMICGIELEDETLKELQITFEWIPVYVLDTVNLKPSILITELQNLPKYSKHLIHRD
ncbi:NUDIX domain-containing protein [Bacteriovoracaceae bacterium]|nr:NUDIX domain-containing protein [Bacteriovoracaceae bacterium]